MSVITSGGDVTLSAVADVSSGADVQTGVVCTSSGHDIFVDDDCSSAR